METFSLGGHNASAQVLAPGAECVVPGFSAIRLSPPAARFTVVTLGADKAATAAEERLGQWRIAVADLAPNGPLMREIHSRVCEFLILGTGFISVELQRVFSKMRVDYRVAHPRIHNTEALCGVFDLFSPRYVILTSGIAGNPNSGWCDDHAFETVLSNVAGQVAAAEVARKKGVPLAVVGSGCVFGASDAAVHDTTLPTAPYATKSFYIHARCAAERMLTFFPEVLQLRVTYPVTTSLHPKSLLGKILTFDVVHRAPTTISVLEDIFPLLPTLLRAGKKGPINFCNPGTVDLSELRCRLEDRRVSYGGERVDFGICGADETFQRAAYAAVPDALLSIAPHLPQASSRAKAIIDALTADEFRLDPHPHNSHVPTEKAKVLTAPTRATTM